MSSLEDAVRDSLADHANAAPSGAGMLEAVHERERAARRQGWVVPAAVAAVLAACVAVAASMLTPAGRDTPPAVAAPVQVSETTASEGGGASPGATGENGLVGGVESTQAVAPELRNWDAQEEISAAAHFEGELVLGGDDCLYVSSAPGVLAEGIWPRGFTRSSEPPGIRGPDGHVLQVGERFATAGAVPGSEEVPSAECREAAGTIYLWPPRGR